jgi:hypothetical protein
LAVVDQVKAGLKTAQQQAIQAAVLEEAAAF